MSNELVQKSIPKETRRLIHPVFYSFHDRFLEELKTLLPHERLFTSEQTFPDGSIGLQFILNDGTVNTIDKYPLSIITAMWLIKSGGYTVREAFTAIDETLDAISDDPMTGEKGLSDNNVVIGPYMGVRSDHASINEQGVDLTGEVRYARMLARKLGSYKRFKYIFGDLHSYEAAEYLEFFNVPFLNLTAAPLIGENLQNRGLITPETSLISLDFGTLQRNLRLLQILGLDPEEYLVVYNKTRDDCGKLHSELVWPKNERTLKKLGKKRAITFDDVIDTGTSNEENTKKLVKLGFKEGILATSHATLSFPARKKLTESLNNGFIKEVITTNSLPIAEYYFENIPQIKVLDWIPTFALAATLLLIADPKDIIHNPASLDGTEFSKLKPYIMMPEPKEDVWSRLSKKI